VVCLFGRCQIATVTELEDESGSGGHTDVLRPMEIQGCEMLLRVVGHSWDPQLVKAHIH
jgi:hypothetical protein